MLDILLFHAVIAIEGVPYIVHRYTMYSIAGLQYNFDCSNKTACVLIYVEMNVILGYCSAFRVYPSTVDSTVWPYYYSKISLYYFTVSIFCFDFFSSVHPLLLAVLRAIVVANTFSRCFAGFLSGRDKSDVRDLQAR